MDIFSLKFFMLVGEKWGIPIATVITGLIAKHSYDGKKQYENYIIKINEFLCKINNSMINIAYSIEINKFYDQNNEINVYFNECTIEIIKEFKKQYYELCMFFQICRFLIKNKKIKKEIDDIISLLYEIDIIMNGIIEFNKNFSEKEQNKFKTDVKINQNRIKKYREDMISMFSIEKKNKETSDGEAIHDFIKEKYDYFKRKGKKIIKR